MAMHVGVARVALYLPENRSLKGKRMVVKSVAQRIRNRFNVAVAEVDTQALVLSPVLDDELEQDHTFAGIAVARPRIEVDARGDLPDL